MPMHVLSDCVVGIHHVLCFIFHPRHNVFRCVCVCVNVCSELLSASSVRFVCSKLKELMMQESNVRPIAAPVTIVGDVHGQYYDVLELFRIGGHVPATNYLFLGDYVDRGNFSLETISLLACLKLRYPERITLVRGNHESRATSMAYGFYAECIAKYKSEEVWKYFVEMFDFMPLSATIDGDIFATHGGISPSLQTLDQIRVLDRFREVPLSGPVCDLMWGDPDPKLDGFRLSPRGAGYVFGRDMVERFCHINGISRVVRAHQLCMNGYQELFDRQFITVWSAPNYCYRMRNLASIMEVSVDLSYHFNTFGPSPVEERNGLRSPSILDFDGDEGENESAIDKESIRDKDFGDPKTVSSTDTDSITSESSDSDSNSVPTSSPTSATASALVETTESLKS